MRVVARQAVPIRAFFPEPLAMRRLPPAPLREERGGRRVPARRLLPTLLGLATVASTRTASFSACHGVARSSGSMAIGPGDRPPCERTSTSGDDRTGRAGRRRNRPRAVGDLDGGVEADDPRGASRRVGRSHQRFERVGGRWGRLVFQRDSPSVMRAIWPSASERNRSIGEKPLGSSLMKPMLRSASKTLGSSRTSTLFPSPQAKTARPKLPSGLARVDGTFWSRSRVTRWTPETSSQPESPGLVHHLQITTRRGSGQVSRRSIRVTPSRPWSRA